MNYLTEKAIVVFNYRRNQIIKKLSKIKWNYKKK